MHDFLKNVPSLRLSKLARLSVVGSSLLLVPSGLASCGSGPEGGTGGASGGAAGEAAGGASGGAKHATGGAAGEMGAEITGGASAGGTSSGSGGEGGEPFSGPSGPFVGRVPVNLTTKIDLLFVIDNSGSMADKQAVMLRAVPAMLDRLVTPNCVQRNKKGEVIHREPGVRAGVEVHCSRSDLSLEFQPTRDLHIGVITSSLGSHGYVGQLSCDEPGKANPEKNDHGYLLPLVRPEDPNIADEPPFLTWNGTEDVLDLRTNFRNQVAAVGETGCGLEAQHEAWYRFLVDPEPPASMSLETNRAVRGPVDEELLAMRREFLRPDSLVAIVLLTDENDCSAMDGGTYYDFAAYGYLTGVVGSQKNAEPTDICATNPNHKCCQTCIDTPNEGCEDDFAKCPERSNPPRLPPELDQNNVRCFQNQRRFGFDLLYPVSRYIDGLSQSQVHGADGDLVTNPLVAGREPGLVLFAAMTGIPWQDLATPETLHQADALKYLSARELAGPVDIDGEKQSYTYWDLILGKPGKHAESTYCQERARDNGTFEDPECGAVPVLPRDPFMVESIEPRTGRADLSSQTNERAKVSLTSSPTWNSINGHEYNTGAGTAPNNDLQYACIFPLGPFDGEKTAEVCDSNVSSCDCGASSAEADKPLCRPSPGAAATGGQFWGKAYPSTRTLEILKGFGEDAVTASICPKVTDSSNPDFGYNPAVAAIVDRLAEKLGGECLSTSLVRDDKTGQVPCVVVETRSKIQRGGGAQDLDCGLSGRLPVTDEIHDALLDQLEESGVCYFESTPKDKRTGNVACDSYQMCSIRQLEVSSVEGQYCLNSPLADSGSPGEAGYCYIDEAQGNPNLLGECTPNAKQRFRFVYPQSAPTPQSATTLYFVCDDAAD